MSVLARCAQASRSRGCAEARAVDRPRMMATVLIVILFGFM